jgi:hypothetical protein
MHSNPHTALNQTKQKPALLQALLAHCCVKFSGTPSPYLNTALSDPQVLPCTASKCVACYCGRFVDVVCISFGQVLSFYTQSTAAELLDALRTTIVRSFCTDLSFFKHPNSQVKTIDLQVNSPAFYTLTTMPNTTNNLYKGFNI